MSRNTMKTRDQLSSQLRESTVQRAAQEVQDGAELTAEMEVKYLSVMKRMALSDRVNKEER